MKTHALPNPSGEIGRGEREVPAFARGWLGTRIADVYGCRRGWWRNRWALGRTRWGAARRLVAIDWAGVRRLVFVCQGNICRSPYAAGRARLAGIPSASCGLRVREEASHPRAIDLAKQRGVDLSRHRPVAVDDFVWRSGDLAVVMELPQVKELAERVQPQATLLGLWSSPRRPHLQDPYGLSDVYFARCFAIIDDAVACLGTRLAKEERE